MPRRVILHLLVACTATWLLAGCDTTEPCDTPATITPHLSPFRLCEQPVTTERTRNVILENLGCDDLHITSAEIRGDVRCSFSKPVLSADAATVAPKGKTFVQLTYRPVEHGVDQAALVVRSDAANFPELIVPICGLGVDATMTGAECADNDDCNLGLECFQDTAAGARCDGSQDAEVACTCQATCPYCQVPADATVNEECGAGGE